MKINITDLPSERFFVKITEEFNKKIYESVNSKYQNFGNFTKIMGLWSGSLYTWRKNNNYPLKVLSEICKLCEIDLKNEQQNIIELKSCFYKGKNYGNAKSKSIFPKFPISLTKELSSLIAHLFCDGCISIDKNGYIHIQYYNKDQKLLQNFKNDVRKVFGDFQIYQSKNKCVDFIALPAPIGLILKVVVRDFNGKTCRIPDFIKDSKDIEIKRAFIRAFADDEGSVKFNPPYRYIELSCSNNQMLSDLRNMVEEFDIRCGNICHKSQRGFDFYYFYIRGYEHLEKFKKEIDFVHEAKFIKLDLMLKSKHRNCYGHEESKSLVLAALKKGKKRKEIASELNRSIKTIDYHIHILKQRGLIS